MDLAFAHALSEITDKQVEAFQQEAKSNAGELGSLVGGQIVVAWHHGLADSMVGSLCLWSPSLGIQAIRALV